MKDLILKKMLENTGGVNEALEIANENSAI